MMGVYLIQSIVKPERVYVGSASDIEKRWRDHIRELNDGKHSSLQLQYHYDKYGQNDLIFEIIESGEYLCKQHLLSREQGWFGHFHYFNKVIPYFNNDPIAGSRLGFHNTEESNKKNSKSHLGKTPWLGKKHKPETIKKLSESKKGNKYCVGRVCSPKMMEIFKKPKTEEHKEKLSKSAMGRPSPRKGVKLSEETKQKLRDINLGKKHTEKTKLKMSDSHKGKKHNCDSWNKGKINVYSEETIMKMKKARRLYWQRKKQMA